MSNPTLKLLYNPGEYIPSPIAPEGVPTVADTATMEDLSPETKALLKRNEQRAKERNQREYEEYRRKTDVRFTGEKPLQTEDHLFAGALIGGSGVKSIASGIKNTFTFLKTHPGLRFGLDTIGTIDGIRNAISDNGIQKTLRLYKEGDIWGTIKSGTGDILDLAGITDLGGTLYRQGKRVGQLARDYSKITGLNTWDDIVNDAVRHYNTYVDPDFNKNWLDIQYRTKSWIYGGHYSPFDKSIKIIPNANAAEKSRYIIHETRHMNDPTIHTPNQDFYWHSTTPDGQLHKFGKTYARTPISDADNKILEKAYPALLYPKTERIAINADLRSLLEQSYTKINGHLPTPEQLTEFIKNINSNELALYRSLSSYNYPSNILTAQFFPNRVKDALINVR